MQDRDLYRGRRLDNGEWVRGYFFEDEFVNEYDEKEINNYILRFLASYDTKEKELTTEAYRVDPSTAGQCTGLRDKNGTLIFEGDILRDDFFKNDIYNGSVSWNERDLRYTFVRLNDKTRVISLSEFTAQDNITCNSAEIIGTIHTTPELMEGNDDRTTLN